MAKKNRSRRRTRAPQEGKLEQNVDAVLLSHGLRINQPIEKLLRRANRPRFVPAKKGERPPRAKTLA